MSRSLVSRAVAVTVLAGVVMTVGASAASAATPAALVGADKASSVTMVVTNTTAQTLTLSHASDSGTWQKRAVDLAPGASETVTNYSAGDASIDLVYTGSVAGDTFQFKASTPLAGGNSASGTSSDSAYQVASSVGSGWHPTAVLTLSKGHTFTYTGATQTYTVPAGVTSLGVVAEGGSGGGSDAPPAGGAEITGTLAVTPGEVLTVAAGGAGSINDGGWGMTNGSTTYGGGASADNSDSSCGGSGGGATVVLNGSGQPVVVAGGGGGSYGGALGRDIGDGGQGGYQGSLTGQDGGRSGGQAGAATSSQGQSGVVTHGDTSAAGGGGVRGGLAGAAGNFSGGGAGSSSDAGLTGAGVSTAPGSGAGQVTFIPLS